MHLFKVICTKKHFLKKLNLLEGIVLAIQDLKYTQPGLPQEQQEDIYSLTRQAIIKVDAINIKKNNATVYKVQTKWPLLL